MSSIKSYCFLKLPIINGHNFCQSNDNFLVVDTIKNAERHILKNLQNDAIGFGVSSGIFIQNLLEELLEYQIEVLSNNASIAVLVYLMYGSCFSNWATSPSFSSKANIELVFCLLQQTNFLNYQYR